MGLPLELLMTRGSLELEVCSVTVFSSPLIDLPGFFDIFKSQKVKSPSYIEVKMAREGFYPIRMLVLDLMQNSSKYF